ncbi:hypothetical protein E5K00_16515 [Hymenobacter aquaticus]|uniref:Dienelactone hydrolase domain-containing protein n=1 Tax=Hymenobacter aquaticus TaxID=1867101 RepID=A0A4Z0PVW3_9BACT|nr:hypothetical protein [Hymenobacter aquaticus]TGE21867.1 hypothetical protein E5K00_16515 [Hymenobacter aquaticus]
MRISPLVAFRLFPRHSWLLCGLAAGLLSGCSSEGTQTTTLPLPVGHYEGPISYQGTEVRVALDLREEAPGKLAADLHFPALGGLSFAAANVRYQEPQLMLEQPGTASKIAVHAIREGDFLRGVFTLDSIKAEFVWVRRGQAAPRAYQQKPLALQANGRARRLLLLIPTDTLSRHPAVALVADAASAATAAARADLLARQGFLAVVVPVGTVPEGDSTELRNVAATFQALRRHAAVDSARVGLWLRGPNAVRVVETVGLMTPAPGFMVLENVEATAAAEAQPFQQLSKLRIPTLALYAANDTSLNARDSARRLRAAVGARGGSQVRVIPQATADFLVPGRLSPDGKWTWPQPAPGFAETLLPWLRQRAAR